MFSATKKAKEAAEKDIDWARMERFRQQLNTPEALQKWEELCSQVRSDMHQTPDTVSKHLRAFPVVHKEQFDHLLDLVPKSGWEKLVIEWRRRTHALPRKAYPFLLLAGPAFILASIIKGNFQA